MSPRMYGRVTEEEVPRARQCCSDACVLGYVSMNEEVNIKGRRIKVKASVCLAKTWFYADMDSHEKRSM